MNIILNDISNTKINIDSYVNKNLIVCTEFNGRKSWITCGKKDDQPNARGSLSDWYLDRKIAESDRDILVKAQNKIIYRSIE